jgi:putative SOS response-associated peptidase YedK
MCGRFTLATPRQVIEQSFGVDLTGVDAPARYNIAPSQDVLTVALGKSGERRAELMHWGLIPHWSKDFKVKGSTINARLETLETSATFRDAFRKRRCLIPADGFYEWQKQEAAVTDRRRRARARIPFWIAPQDGPLFAFAGVYGVWRARDGDPWLLSCAIVTAPASAALASIHDRMPLILRPEDWPTWIARDPADLERARDLLAPDPAVRYRAHRVSLLVNDPAHDGPELIRAAEGDASSGT